MKLFDFNVGNYVSFVQVLDIQKKLLNDEKFLNICGNCRWFDLCVKIRKTRAGKLV